MHPKSVLTVSYDYLDRKLSKLPISMKMTPIRKELEAEAEKKVAQQKATMAENEQKMREERCTSKGLLSVSRTDQPASSNGDPPSGNRQRIDTDCASR